MTSPASRSGIQPLIVPHLACLHRHGTRPHGRSQVQFVGQADCLQAYLQNHAPGCDPRTDRRKCNSWDQGTVFFDNAGRVWGQPTFYCPGPK